MLFRNTTNNSILLCKLQINIHVKNHANYFEVIQVLSLNHKLSSIAEI